VIGAVTFAVALFTLVYTVITFAFLVSGAEAGLGVGILLLAVLLSVNATRFLCEFGGLLPQAD
jgi:hypothetical protein